MTASTGSPDRTQRGPATPTHSMRSADVGVLFVAAAGRSGSTLLERLLARLPDVAAAGELVHLWERGLRDDERCGCGESFHACERWQDVGRRAYGGWDKVDVADAVALRWRVDRQRRIPGMIAPSLARDYAADLRRHGERLGKLYRAVADSAGVSTVVDSSKHASTAFLLPHVPGIQAHVIHLVRDPRGVANSWTRKVVRPETAGAPSLMPTYRPTHAALRWLLQNLEMEAVARTTSLPVTSIRYEDLVACPLTELARVAAATGLEGAPTRLGEPPLRLDVDHTVSGNPSRFRTGPLQLRPDEGWRTELPPAQRRRVELLTLPLRRRYGYMTTDRNPDAPCVAHTS